MANTFLTPDIIAGEALVVLENNLIMANLVHRDYSNEFVNVGGTITVRKPASFVANNFTGSIIRQDATEGSVTVKIGRHRDVSFGVSSKEMTLDIREFSNHHSICHCEDAKKTATPLGVTVFFKCRRRPIFPGRLHPSIFGTVELNDRVRNGNGWILNVINTD